MNKILFLGFLITILSCVSDDDDTNTFYVIGKLSKPLSGQSVILSIQENNQFTPLDTTEINEDNFSLTGTLERPVVANVRIDSIPNSLSFFMEKDSVIINVNSADMSKSTVQGSDLHAEYLDFIAKNNKILSKMKLYYPLLQKARSENNAERLQIIHQKMAAIQREKNSFALNYAWDHPNSYIGAFALYTLLVENTIPADTISAVLNTFSVPVRKSDYALQTLIYLDSIEAAKPN